MSESIINLNQSSLQDFIDCPRRFQLRWVLGNQWPAASSIPLDSLENSIRLGTRFHQLAHQFFQGIDPDLLISSITDPDLLEMFNNFLEFSRKLTSSPLYTEVLLHLPYHGYRLTAKYDLVLQDGDQILIIDWKTSPKKPDLSRMSNSAQSNLYPFIFLHAGGDLFPKAKIMPGAIRFMYWFPLSSEPELLCPTQIRSSKRTKSN